MPFGDPRPIRRKTPKPLGRGLKVTSASRQRPDPQPMTPDPLKVASMVQAALEIAPRIMIPLEVRAGAREAYSILIEDQPHAVLDVLNHEDGNQYMVMVMPLPKPPQPPESSPSSSSR